MPHECPDNENGKNLDRLRAEASTGAPPALDALLQLATTGDREALTALVQLGLERRMPEAHDRLMTFAERYLIQAARQHRRSSSDDPESMAHNGIVELLRKSPVLQEYTGSAFIGYLNRMAHNWAYDEECKRRLRHQTTLGGEGEGHRKPPIAGPDPMPALIAREKLKFLLSCCPNEADELVLRKRFEESLPYEAIGRLLTPPQSADAVRMQIKRILVRLGDDPRIQRECDP